MKFEYGNTFSKNESTIPVFLRCRGINGSLSLDFPEDSVDKIKIVLQGKSLYLFSTVHIINNENRNTYKHSTASRWLFIPLPATPNCDQSPCTKIIFQFRWFS